MNYVFFCKIAQAFKDIFYDRNGSFLIEGALLLDLAVQTAIVTQFGYDIAVMIAHQNFIAPQNIGMIQALQDFNFRVQ